MGKNLTDALIFHAWLQDYLVAIVVYQRYSSLSLGTLNYAPRKNIVEATIFLRSKVMQ